MDAKYIKQKKFFFRFLKENGVYSAYIKYIRNPKTYNFWQREYPNWTFDSCAMSNGMNNMVSVLITWDSTDEGYNFWNRLSIKFNKEFRIKFP